MAQFPKQHVLAPQDGQTAILYREVMAGTIHAQCITLRQFDPFTWLIRITNLLEGHTLDERIYKNFGVGWKDIYAVKFLFEPVGNR